MSCLYNLTSPPRQLYYTRCVANPALMNSIRVILLIFLAHHTKLKFECISFVNHYQTALGFLGCISGMSIIVSYEHSLKVRDPPSAAVFQVLKLAWAVYTHFLDRTILTSEDWLKGMSVLAALYALRVYCSIIIISMKQVLPPKNEKAKENIETSEMTT